MPPKKRKQSTRRKLVKKQLAMAIAREKETLEQKQNRKEADRLANAAARSAEAEEDHRVRQERDSAPKAKAISTQTEEKLIRRQNDAATEVDYQFDDDCASEDFEALPVTFEPIHSSIEKCHHTETSEQSWILASNSSVEQIDPAVLSDIKIEIDIADESLQWYPTIKPQTTERRRYGGDFCSAIGCRNARGKPECKKMSFFRFPRDPERSRIWVQNSRRDDLIGKTAMQLNKSGYVLCSNHFEPNQFNRPFDRDRLIWKAVPTLFDMPNPPPTGKRPKPRKQSSISPTAKKKRK